MMVDEIFSVSVDLEIDTYFQIDIFSRVKSIGKPI